MKILKRVQKQYAILGISSSNQWAEIDTVNRRELLGFLIYGFAIASYVVYFFQVANGFMEKLDCICATSATIIAFINFAAIAFRKTTLFQCIDNIKNLIETSEPISQINFS